MDMTTQQENIRTGSRRVRAADIRRKARLVLDGRSVPQNRMTLILSLIVVLVTAVGVYMLSIGLYMVGYLIVGDALWLDIATYGLMGLLALLLVLPLASATWRLACLMTVRSTVSAMPSGLPVTAATPTLSEVFHPFTSLRAYGRTLVVGLETLGWAILSVGLPLAGYRTLAGVFAQMANRGVHTSLCNLLTGVSLLLCLAFGVLMLFLSGLRAGFGYFVFIHDGISVSEVNRYFRGFRRGFVRPFVLRISLAGWVALSVVAILVPFLLHTIPYGLCCGAVYAGELKRK